MNDIRFSQILNRRDNNVELAKTLLTKRSAFKHEKEIRFLAYTSSSGDNDTRRNNNLYYVPIDPNKAIEEIRFDPRINDDVYNCWKTCLRKLNYEGKILRSSLYSGPKIDISM